MAIGFVPTNLVLATFAKLQDDAPVTIHNIYAYFEQQWLGNVSVDMWNVYDTDTRTNNSCEGWHNRFNRAVDRHHPNLWHLLSIILEEQASTEVLLCQIAAGQNVLRERQKYTAMKKRIQTITKRYQDGLIDIFQYVDGISFHIKV